MHTKIIRKYYFINKFDTNNINKQDKQTVIIYRNYSSNRTSEDLILKIRNHCKKRRVKFYVSNNIKLAIRLDLDGVYIPSFNKDTKHLAYTYKKKFDIIGSAHNLKEIRIKENINSQKNDLSNSNDWSCQGLSGVDYMLHGFGISKDEIIQKYKDDSYYGDYLENLLAIMTSNTADIIQDWSTYRNTFVQSSGNSNTSSLNILTNDFIYYFEKGLRTNKVAIPVGYFSGGNILP